MSKSIYPCLWFDGKAKEAAEYYCYIFKDGKIITDTPMVVIWEVNGFRFMGLNGGPHFTFNEAVSFVLPCSNQEEIDYYWEKLLADGGKEKMCGWLSDKYGVCWQVVPYNMGVLVTNPNNGQRAMQAMMGMKKIIIKELEEA